MKCKPPLPGIRHVKIAAFPLLLFLALMLLACEAAAPTERRTGASVLTVHGGPAPPRRHRATAYGSPGHAQPPTASRRSSRLPRTAAPSPEAYGPPPTEAPPPRGPDGNAAAGARKHRSRRGPEVYIHRGWSQSRLWSENRRCTLLLGTELWRPSHSTFRPVPTVRHGGKLPLLRIEVQRNSRLLGPA